MKSTRERILQTLLNHPRSSINDLADAVGINAISVRHHLTNMQAEGTVIAEEERHGVGRPRLVYSLTEKGVERFPTRYLRLTNRLLEQIKEKLPEPAVQQLFAKMADELAKEYVEKAANLPMDQRLNYLKQTLIQEGFILEWEEKEGYYEIRELSCPYYHVSQNHPEVCVVDQTLIASILKTPIRKTGCVLQGDQFCTYRFQISDEIQEKTYG